MIEEVQIEDMAIEETVTTQELTQLMRERAAVYQFLSALLLKEFEAEQIANLSSFASMEVDDVEMRQALAVIKRYMTMAGADPRTDLAVDYARIFLSAGVYEGITAEPYESVFTSEEHLLMQDARDDVLGFYRALGVAVDPALHMPEDHLGIEFEFMALAAQKTAELLVIADGYGEVLQAIELQQQFAQAHILNWIDDLIAKVDEFAKLPVYPAFMRFAKAYTKQDEELLEEIGNMLKN